MPAPAEPAQGGLCDQMTESGRSRPLLKLGGGSGESLRDVRPGHFGRSVWRRRRRRRSVGGWRLCARAGVRQAAIGIGDPAGDPIRRGPPCRPAPRRGPRSEDRRPRSSWLGRPTRSQRCVRQHPLPGDPRGDHGATERRRGGQGDRARDLRAVSARGSDLRGNRRAQGHAPDRVWSKNSCGRSVVELQEAPETLAASHGPVLAQLLARKEEEGALKIPWWFRSPWKCSTYARNAVRSAGSPTRISFARHSSFTDRTQRSAYAFRFGRRGGNRTGLTPLSRTASSNAAQYLPSRSCHQIPMVGEAAHISHREVPRDLGHPAFVREGGYSPRSGPDASPHG